MTFWDISEADSLKPEEHLYPEPGKQMCSVLQKEQSQVMTSLLHKDVSRDVRKSISSLLVYLNADTFQ